MLGKSDNCHSKTLSCIQACNPYETNDLTVRIPLQSCVREIQNQQILHLVVWFCFTLLPKNGSGKAKAKVFFHLGNRKRNITIDITPIAINSPFSAVANGTHVLGSSSHLCGNQSPILL